MKILYIFIYLIIGFVSGIFTGSIGIGSGVLLIPFLTQFGMTLSQAVATALVNQLVPRGFFGVTEYYKSGDIKLNETVLIILGSSIGIYLGALIHLNHYLSERTLYFILSIILFVASIYLFIKHVIYHSNKINITN